METLDLLISKFKEVKDELAKADPISPLHDTVEGFMGGLKALPKGSAERGKFITSHMNHPAFVGALSAHPDGARLHGILTNHLNSAANAGPKAFGGAKTLVKNDEELEKAKTSMVGHMKGAGNTTLTNPNDMSRANTFRSAMAGEFQPAPKPAVRASKPAVAPKLTGLDRIRAESKQPIIKADLLKQGTADKKYANEGFSKTVNSSYGGKPNEGMAMSCGEKLTLNKDGQWDLEKATSPFRNHVSAPASSVNVPDGAHGKSGFQITVPPPARKPAGMGMAGVGDIRHTGNTGSTTAISGDKTVNDRPSNLGDKTGVLPVPVVKDETGMPKDTVAKVEEAKCSKCGLEPVSNPANGLCTKCRVAGAQDKMKARGTPVEKPVAHPPIKKSECSKCHADPCECQTSGVLVDKMDGAATGNL